MLSPTVTWGDLRQIFVDAYMDGTEIPDNLLADPAYYEESKGKANDEYVFPERAKEYLEMYPEGDQSVTAAATPEASEITEDTATSPLFFTVDDDDNVLELVKEESEEDGLYIRIDGEWEDISEENDFPTVYEKTIKYANDESVSAWDSTLEGRDTLKLSDVSEYLED